jgi:dolichol-phosphate mannosyltransferase
MKVSVLIPTKNEPYVGTLSKEIHRILKGRSHEIIIIDKSRTPPKVNGALVITQKSNGLGNAILEGVGYAKGDVLVTMDGDGSHRPIDVLKLLDAIKGGADIAIGSKFAGRGKTKDRYHRKLISQLFRIFERVLLRTGVQDPMSGFAAIKREVYENVRLNPLGYKINMEIVFKAKRLGYVISEVPIIFVPRKAGKSKSSMMEGAKTLLFIVKLRLGF